MDEVSNNVLLFLAVLAIGISVFGIYTTITNIGPSLIGGAATGTANVTIQTSTTISISPSNINFTQAQQSQTRNSSESTEVTGCGGDFLCGINISNDGNVLLDIQLTVAEDMFTSPSANTTAMVCRACNASTACPVNYNRGGALPVSTNQSYVPCVNSVGNIGGDAEFIDALNYTDGSDNVYVDVMIYVPADEPVGQKGATLTFTASQDA